MFAHYYGSKVKGFELIITRSPGLSEIVSRQKVAGKKEARKIAEALNAKPWNF